MAVEEPIRELARRALLCVDKRSLGLTRIAMGLVLLGDLARRAASAGLWYREDGPLPAEVYRSVPYLFSPMLSSPGLAIVWASFIAAAIFDLAVLFGYRTRLAQLLALAALVSLQSRVRALQNGGDRTLCILLFWTMFLPMSARFSIDARRQPRDDTPACSLAYFAILLQLAIAYFLNSIRKAAGIWIDGSALSYLLRDPTITSGFGSFVGEHAPRWLLAILTRATRAIEFMAPFLILTPLYTTLARRIALVLLVGFHVGIAALMNVGVFSFAMMAFYPLLLTSDDWTVIERWLRAHAGGRLVAAWDRIAAAAPAPVVAPRSTGSRRLVVAREAIAAAFLVVTLHRVLLDNGGLGPEAAGPRLFRAMIEYPHLYQNWGLFTSDHPTANTVLVDAETADGRHVDPFREVTTPELHQPLPWTRFPTCMNLDAFGADYEFVVRRNTILWKPFGAWILRYPERTGRAEDRIVRFEVFDASQEIRARDAEPAPLKLRPLFHYPSDEPDRR